MRDTALTPFAGIGAVLLPAPLAEADRRHRSFGKEVTLAARRPHAQAPLYAAAARKADRRARRQPDRVAPLFYAQELTGLPGRV